MSFVTVHAASNLLTAKQQQTLEKACDGDEQSLRQLMTEANSGETHAQDNLGLMFKYGEGVTQSHEMASYWFSHAAKQGYADAQNNLAIMYLNGQGVEQNSTLALEWLHKAVSQNHNKAQYTLGHCYENGQCVPQNNVAAADWYQRSLDNNFPTAFFALGRVERLICETGDIDFAKAKFEQHAKNGRIVSQGLLATAYFYAHNYEMAAYWFVRVAQQNTADHKDNLPEVAANFIAEALFYLGWMHCEGAGVEQSYDIGFEYIHQSATKELAIEQHLIANGELKSEYTPEWQSATMGKSRANKAKHYLLETLCKAPADSLAIKMHIETAHKENKSALLLVEMMGLHATKHVNLAEFFFKQSAKNGHPLAQYHLAEAYLNSGNYTQAGMWYQEAANQGHAGAALSLGQIYLDDEDFTNAFHWFQKAANAGNAEAQLNLGIFYDNGQGIEQSDTLAKKWFEQSANNRNTTAQFCLGVMYANGQAVNPNSIIAYALFTLAAEDDEIDEAQDNLQALTELMSVEEIETAEDLAKKIDDGICTREIEKILLSVL